MPSLEDLGLLTKDLILGLADWLREPQAPGLVSLALLLTLVLLSGTVFYRNWRRIAALRWLIGHVTSTSSREDFRQSLPELNRQAAEAAERPRGPRKEVATAWMEYNETMVLDEDETIVRNSVRPATFFDPEEMGFAAGFSRAVPGLFVSVGLLLTFLGLISALAAIEGQLDDAALQALLAAASAKFIMSLTGLACSIVFTVVLRWQMLKVERSARRLGHALEKRMRFDSLEDLARIQLRETRAMRDHVRQVGQEIVADLGRPLREDLPAAFRGAITEALAPVLEQVGRTGQDGVRDLANSLGEQVTESIGAAMRDAAERLGQAAERLEAISGGLGQGAQAAGDAMGEGAERMLRAMFEALEEIKRNTGESVAAMTAAAEGMREAADGFGRSIEAAATSGAEAARTRMAGAAEEAGDEIGRAANEVGAPLRDLAGGLTVAAERAAEGAGRLERMAQAIERGSVAFERTGAAAEGTARALSEAGAPVAASARALSQSSTALMETMAATLDGAREANLSAARQAEAVLEEARAVLGEGHAGVTGALRGIEAAVEAFRGQGDRIDEIDEKLGRAFERFAAEVAAQVDTMASRTDQIVAAFEPALGTLQTVVEQAERFAPNQSRTAAE